ncbi:hypothetical protein [Brachybacterium kimchii]|uniref:DUF308 domain-containing protein n=1 Tax=Brachybacterium kimchii TaxID=2942909 RepID=A0ABY4N7I2_9MICO|nr:hypothetical protein [Brachybacterium kimchii]UQN29125.1 hypothetical protein M4486_16065 [Brachybacterium kimchii]
MAQNALPTSAVPASVAAALRGLYLVRFVFALVWALVLFAVGTGPVLVPLLVIYPLFDAAAVLWQLRRTEPGGGGRPAERVNIGVSVVVAVAVGIAAGISPASALVVWGLWAIGAGVPQLLAAVRRRRLGGQVPQMLSGGISVLAGASFLLQGLHGSSALTSVGGYAVLGGIFFLVSALRLRPAGRNRAA